MATNRAINSTNDLNMKILFYLFFICSIKSYAQNGEIAHVSFNLNNEIINKDNRKIIEKNGEITFYIKGNYFRYIDNLEITNALQNEIEKLDLKTILDLMIYRNELIEKNIKNSEKNGNLKILQNFEVYKQIYIYEKENGSILKYPVIWLEVIECQ